LEKRFRVLKINRYSKQGLCGQQGTPVLKHLKITDIQNNQSAFFVLEHLKLTYIQNHPRAPF
jgi:hypothetical protein